jgi:hypothetical protein
MALKVVEIAITTINKASSTRHMSCLAMRACAAACLEPDRSSCTTIMAKATPIRIVMMPGTTKAERQPKYCPITPVASADDATPRLPQTPFRPISRPSLSA